MRQLIGTKKLKRYRELTGLPIAHALVRGGTDRRIDLCLDNGAVVSWHKDGALELNSIAWGTHPFPKEYQLPVSFVPR